MIRLRRIAPVKGKRRLYEVDFDDGLRDPIVTRAPHRYLIPSLGVGDSWVVFDAADLAWNGDSGAWESLYFATPQDPPRPRSTD